MSASGAPYKVTGENTFIVSVVDVAVERNNEVAMAILTIDVNKRGY